MYFLWAARSCEGVSVAVSHGEPQLTVADTRLPVDVSTSLKVVVVIVLAFISSEKVALTLVVRATPVAPLIGEVLLTDGAVVSVVATVQVRPAGVRSTLPFASKV